MKPFPRFVGLLVLGAALSTRGAADELPPRHAVDLFGQRIEYYDVGSGPTLILLHGLATSAEIDWGACIHRLAKHYHVLAPDQIGFGASAKPMITYGVQTWVDFLGEFLRVEKVQGFTLAGESLGGWISALYTEQALGRQSPVGQSFLLPMPDHLILVDAAGHRHGAEVIASMPTSSLSLAASKGLLSAIYFGPEHHTDDAVRRQFATSLASGNGWTMQSFFSNKAIVAESLDDQLGKISIPTLIVWGANDHIVPLEDGKDFAAKIPGAKLVVVPECGHAPGIEKPDALCDAIEQFLGTP